MDALDVVADGKDGLPAGDGVGADDGVDSLEDFAYILGCTALACVDLKVVALGGVIE